MVSVDISKHEACTEIDYKHVFGDMWVQSRSLKSKVGRSDLVGCPSRPSRCSVK